MGFKLAILSLAFHMFTATALPPQPPCVCTRNLEPVCGSDGQTYSNHCLLECQKYKTGKEITVEKEGPCDGIQEPVCFCTFEYKPVCGTDGNTYSNKCELLCKRSALPDIDVGAEGACDAVRIAEPPCNCPDVIQEVCGSDGNTYENDCRLNCATAKNPSLSIKSYTKCDDKIQVVEPIVPRPPPCICTDELNEVCGSDGVTYANPCLLNCATANNPSLSIKSYSRCDDNIQVADPIVPRPPPCICTDELNKVCGSDGVTYANPCQLNCATANNPSLSVKSHGKCAGLPRCVCPRNKRPVCGTNGVTYSNECLLRCAGATLDKNVPC